MGAGAAMAIDVIFGLLDRVAAYTAIVTKARAEGRDVSDVELNALAREDDAARDKLAQSIATAKAQGR